LKTMLQLGCETTFGLIRWGWQTGEGWAKKRGEGRDTKRRRRGTGAFKFGENRHFGGGSYAKKRGKLLGKDLDNTVGCTSTIYQWGTRGSVTDRNTSRRQTYKKKTAVDARCPPRLEGKREKIGGEGTMSRSVKTYSNLGGRGKKRKSQIKEVSTCREKGGSN